MFAHSGWDEAQAKKFVEAVAKAAGDTEWKDRVKGVEYSYNNFRADAKVTGFPSLTEHVDERAARQAAVWLDILTKLGKRKAQSGRAYNSNRPTIRIVAGDLERIVDDAEHALISADRGVYQRDARIVSIGDAKLQTASSGEIIGKRIF